LAGEETGLPHAPISSIHIHVPRKSNHCQVMLSRETGGIREHIAWNMHTAHITSKVYSGWGRQGVPIYESILNL
jgi:hypothetical protein